MKLSRLEMTLERPDAIVDVLHVQPLAARLFGEVFGCLPVFVQLAASGLQLDCQFTRGAKVFRNLLPEGVQHD